VFNDPQVELANLRPGNYDLMIIDIGMPKVSGFDLYRAEEKRRQYQALLHDCI
jgi:DNA-binding response OmpR family regulator